MKKPIESNGGFVIIADGITNLEKADAKYFEDTEFSITISLMEDGVEVAEEEISYSGNSILIPSESNGGLALADDLRSAQFWAENQTKLAADTVKMIKPNMDYNDLYEERADHLYVAALLTNSANPYRAPKYSAKFILGGAT